MLFNNSIIDFPFISSTSDDFPRDYSDTNYPINIDEFPYKLSPSIICELLKTQKPEFVIEARKNKRGRNNVINKRKKEHSKLSQDNIICKIQTHFLTFIPSFVNDSINRYYKYQKYKFLNLDYKEKSKVTFDYLYEIKNSSIGEILSSMRISPKYKIFNKDTNINNLKELEGIPFFENIFKMKYLDLFVKYFNNKNQLKELLIGDAIITLSPKTKTFYDLLQKNSFMKKDLIDVAENFYINDINLNFGDDTNSGN